MKKVCFIVVASFACILMTACSGDDAIMIESLEKEVVLLENSLDEINETNEGLQEENELLKEEINKKSLILEDLQKEVDQLNQVEESEAERILSWFNGISEPEVENAEQVWSDDGVIYYLPVAEEGLTDMQALRDYLLLYFDEKNVDELLSLKAGDYLPFIEIDGILYRGMGLVGN